MSDLKATDVTKENQQTKRRETRLPNPSHHAGPAEPGVAMLALQNAAGNQAVSKLMPMQKGRRGYPLLQAKLTANQSGDKYEQQANRIADKVITMPEPVIDANKSRLAAAQSLEAIYPLSAGHLSPQTDDEEELSEVNETPNHAHTSSADFAGPVAATRRYGRPLDQTARTFFESRFGQDFSSVRVHTNAEAREMAREVGARAFTVGQDIMFGASEYTPESREGQRLIAHELTHVVQQAGSRTPGVIQRQPRALTGKERRERRRERRALRRGARRATREREKMTERGEEVGDVATLRLLTFTETVNPNRLTLRELKQAQVGHSWVELSVDQPDEIPEGIGEPTRNLLEGGGTALGFWPLINRTEDIDADDLESLLEEVQERESEGYTPGAGFTDQPGITGYSTKIFASFVPGRVEEPDDAHKGEETGTKEYRLTEDEIRSLMAYVDSKRSASYSLFKFNCTTFAIEAVRASGHTAPNAATLGVKIPNALRRDLFKLKKRGDDTVTLSQLAAETRQKKSEE